MRNITLYKHESEHNGERNITNTKCYNLWKEKNYNDIKSVRIVVYIDNKTEIFESNDSYDVIHIANKIFTSEQTKEICNHTFTMPYKDGVMYVNFFECELGEYFDKYTILML